MSSILPFKVAMFSGSSYIDKMDVNNKNLRIGEVWQLLFNADHYNYTYVNHMEGKQYDLGIVLLPARKHLDIEIFLNNIKVLLKSCKHYTIMQEGLVDTWMQYSIEQQFALMKLYNESKFILCHNDFAVKFYNGMFNKPTYIMDAVILEDQFAGIVPEKKYDAIIGGCLNGIYNGLVSVKVAKHFTEKDITVPEMYDMIPNEQSIAGISHMKYTYHRDWMLQLSKYKLGVHMMPQPGAGSFNLACAFWGIPCIGYKNSDTQRICHPNTSVDLYDVRNANRLAVKLKNDSDFYDACSKMAKLTFNNTFGSNIFLDNMKNTFIKELNLPTYAKLHFI